MEITDVRIKPILKQGKLKAYVTVTFDDCFVLHNVKVIEGKDQSEFFIAMPSRRLQNGQYKDTAHPISAEFRAKLEEKILHAWKNQSVPEPPMEGFSEPE